MLVALTGYGLDEDRKRVVDAGFDEHLLKPVALEQLERVMASAARAHPTGSEASPATSPSPRP